MADRIVADFRHDHVGVTVLDLERATAWYCETFGLEREFATRIDAIDLDIEMLRNPTHGYRVELLHRASTRSGSRPANPAEAALIAGLGHIAFGVDHLENSFARAVAAGARPVMEPCPSPEPGVRMAFVADPEGNLVELLQRSAADGAVVRTVVDCVYRDVVGFRPLKLDLHLPSHSDDATPVLVYLHGGGWQRGSREQVLPALADADPPFFARVVAAGFAVAAVDYRLSGESVFPAAVDDVVAAVRWVREHAAEYGLDAGPVYLWGESAGAHLALLTALATDIGTPADVGGLVAWFPPTDFLGLDADAADVGGEPHGQSDSRESRLLGAAVADVPDLARAASPLAYVRGDAPPILLMHGEADLMVPARQSVRLAEALRRAGAPVELELVAGAGHMWRGCRDIDAIVERSLSFLRGVHAETAGRRGP